MGAKTGLGDWLSGRGRFLRHALLELVYPSLCEVCGRSLVRGECYICTGCMADFPFADRDFRPYRLLSGLPDGTEVPLYALFRYDKNSPYRQLVYLLKYSSHRQLGRYLGRMLGQRMRGDCLADCIVPVPLHPVREKERGYNQAAEIARGIADVLRIELVEDALCRNRNNPSQTGMSTSERLDNVEGIFSLLRPERIAGRHVLLVDDVVTTGATAVTCLSALSAVEGVECSMACLARAL